jgi:predicted deacylase
MSAIKGADRACLPANRATAFAAQSRLALMSEAGANGLADEASIQFHVDGVLNVAHALGMIDTAPLKFSRARTLRDIADLDSVWEAWVDPANPSTRATCQARLADDEIRVEIVFTGTSG